MPRSHGVIKNEVWETGSDFRRLLNIDAQWAFAMLISQPQINNLGLLPYLPEKWWRFAVGLTRDRLDHALARLEECRYTITDQDTGELLVRTFIRHDKVWSQPQLVANARTLIRAVESEPIHSYLIGRHPWLVDPAWDAKKIAKHETASHPPETPPLTPRETPRQTPPETPLDEEPDLGTETPRQTPRPRGITSRARAQEGLPQPLPQPQPQPPLAKSEAVPRPPAHATPTERPPEITTIKTTVADSLAQAQRGAAA